MLGSGPYVFALRKPDEDVDKSPSFLHSGRLSEHLRWALYEIADGLARMSATEAKSTIEKLQADHRYINDVWAPKNSQTPGSRSAVHVLMGEKRKNCLERRNLTESTIVRRSIGLPVLFESCRGSAHTRP
ncbi:hypothetical protein TNCV_1979301 [Trichonephila clavipes]|nr:hypothetical protein TNCV_1979301 [Trichonephila clavipes]